jgi:hypothetical protein
MRNDSHCDRDATFSGSGLYPVFFAGCGGKQ